MIAKRDSYISTSCYKCVSYVNLFIQLDCFTIPSNYLSNMSIGCYLIGCCTHERGVNLEIWICNPYMKRHNLHCLLWVLKENKKDNITTDRILLCVSDYWEKEFQPRYKVCSLNSSFITTSGFGPYSSTWCPPLSGRYSFLVLSASSNLPLDVRW